MKNAISMEAPGTRVLRRVKWHYVSLAVGLGLAATAFIGLRGTASDGVASSTARAATITRQPAAQHDRETVVFYLAGSPEAAALANSYEEMAQWIRYDNGSPEPNRSVKILSTSTEEDRLRAHKLVDDAMAAANFTSSEAPRFVVVELQ